MTANETMMLSEGGRVRVHDHMGVWHEGTITEIGISEYMHWRMVIRLDDGNTWVFTQTMDQHIWEWFYYKPGEH